MFSHPIQTTADFFSFSQAPLLKEQRVEYERLSVEATHLASQLAQSVADRDAADRRSEAYRLDVDRLERDNTILGHQLRDLGRQVRTLMRSIASSSNLISDSSSNPDDFDEEEAEIQKRAEEDSTTDAVVSAHLVTFRSINELQVQNQKLLRITREMGAQMERGEDAALGRRRHEENKAVEEAHELILRLKDEVESQRSKTDAFERERDMFRRMLAQRGAGGESTGMGERNGNTGGGGAMDGDTPRLLADVQSNFDAYKSEIAVDSQRLREDLKDAQQAASAARTDLAKTKAQSEFLAGELALSSFVRSWS
jgi:nucleoprotein TPR